MCVGVEEGGVPRREARRVECEEVGGPKARRSQHFVLFFHPPAASFALFLQKKMCSLSGCLCRWILSAVQGHAPPKLHCVSPLGHVVRTPPWFQRTQPSDTANSGSQPPPAPHAHGNDLFLLSGGLPDGILLTFFFRHRPGPKRVRASGPEGVGPAPGARPSGV